MKSTTKKFAAILLLCMCMTACDAHTEKTTESTVATEITTETTVTEVSIDTFKKTTSTTEKVAEGTTVASEEEIVENTTVEETIKLTDDELAKIIAEKHMGYINLATGEVNMDKEFDWDWFIDEETGEVMSGYSIGRYDSENNTFIEVQEAIGSGMMASNFFYLYTVDGDLIFEGNAGHTYSLNVSIYETDEVIYLASDFRYSNHDGIVKIFEITSDQIAEVGHYEYMDYGYSDDGEIVYKATINGEEVVIFEMRDTDPEGDGSFYEWVNEYPERICEYKYISVPKE